MFMKYLSESLKSIGKILLLMYVVTAMLLFLLAVLVQRFNWDNNAISIGISTVYVISCFIGGFFVGKVQQNKKFIWGILIGLAYVIIMLVITLVVKHGFHSSVSAFVTNLLLCLSSGMLGGMLSWNMEPCMTASLKHIWFYTPQKKRLHLSNDVI